MAQSLQAQEKEVMKYETTLPEDFDGKFRFTNSSDEEFIGKWGGKEYRFPAKSTCEMNMPNETLYDIQYIRKKFARDYAEREFFKSQKYEKIRSREGVKDDMNMITPRGQGMSHAGMYTFDDLIPYIQSCLKPLPSAKITVQEMKDKRDVASSLVKDSETGEPVTEVIDGKTSLRAKALAKK